MQEKVAHNYKFDSITLLMTQNFAGAYGEKERRLAYEREPTFASGGAPRYNITRAFSQLKDVDPANPAQAAAGVVDMVHAIGFKGGSDLLKLGRSDNEPMEPLRGWQRVKESTLGALGNIGGGFARMIGLSEKGFQPVRGVLQIGQGVLDVLDVVPSVVADGTRIVASVDSRGASVHHDMKQVMSNSETHYAQSA